MTNETTCQICGREIQAKKGLIAHHGYKRPQRGSGWQTSSCLGARYEPYEKSNKRIGEVIPILTNYVRNNEAKLKELEENPPAILTVTKRQYGLYRKPEYIDVPRPENFTKDTPRDYTPYSYASAYHNERHDLQQNIKYTKEDIANLQKRYDNWRLR